MAGNPDEEWLETVAAARDEAPIHAACMLGDADALRRALAAGDQPPIVRGG